MNSPRHIKAITDFPEIVRSEGALMLKRESRPQGERKFMRDLADAYNGWRDLIGLDEADEITLEVTLSHDMRRMRGCCRADAIIWHKDRSISIVEAKIGSSPVEICGAIGQLIYYKTLAEKFWGVQVSGLICASRSMPEYVLDAIANVRAPIRFLKAPDDGSFHGITLDYSRLDEGKR